MNPETIQQLKNKIYSQVDEIEDITALQMLQESITAYSSPSKKDIIDDLTEDQQKRLYASIRQAMEGKTFSDEEVKQKAKEWLSR